MVSQRLGLLIDCGSTKFNTWLLERSHLHPVAGWGKKWRFSCVRSETGTHCFYTHSLVSPNDGGAGKCSLVMCPERRGLGFGKELASLYHTSSFHFIFIMRKRERERERERERVFLLPLS